MSLGAASEPWAVVVVVPVVILVVVASTVAQIAAIYFEDCASLVIEALTARIAMSNAGFPWQRSNLYQVYKKKYTSSTLERATASEAATRGWAQRRRVGRSLPQGPHDTILSNSSSNSISNSSSSSSIVVVVVVLVVVVVMRLQQRWSGHRIM